MFKSRSKRSQGMTSVRLPLIMQSRNHSPQIAQRSSSSHCSIFAEKLEQIHEAIKVELQSPRAKVRSPLKSQRNSLSAVNNLQEEGQDRRPTSSSQLSQQMQSLQPSLPQNHPNRSYNSSRSLIYVNDQTSSRLGDGGKYKSTFYLL